MTAPRNPDDLIRAFLGEGETDLPDRAFDAVRADIHRTRQRVVIGPWREPQMSTFARVAIAAVAVVAVGFLGRELLDSGPLAATPSASLPSASPSIAASPVLDLPANGLIAIGRDDAILLIDPATGETVKRLAVPSPLITEITWAPDGQRFAFTIGDNPRLNGVWVMDVSEGTSRQILACGDGPDGCGIDWAPDGSRIAVTHGHRLELIDPDGGNATQLQGFSQWVFGPTWSPDSTRIAVFNLDINNVDRGGRLFAIDRDGSDLTLLAGPPLDVGGATWSPDGSTFAYIVGREVRTCPESVITQECFDEWSQHVMSLALDGSEPRELRAVGRCGCFGVGPSLGWSPDGTSMVLVIPDPVVRPNQGDFGLFVMSADGRDLRRVLEGYASAPAWQPVP